MNRERKVCAITGCNTGIGLFTAFEMARQNYEVLMLVRDSDKSRAAQEQIRRAAGSDSVHIYYVDLADQSSIRQVAGAIKANHQRLDALINNAGILMRDYRESPDGFELTMAVNYFGVYSLTVLLLPLLQYAPEARIVNVSSEMYKRGEAALEGVPAGKRYNGIKAYSDSKFLLVCLSNILADQLEPHGITVNCLHPGFIGTDVFRKYPSWLTWLLRRFIATPEEGARPSVHVATSAATAGVTGKYFRELEMKNPIPPTRDPELLAQLWQWTQDRTGIPFPGA